jgi:hypothetical protein
MTDYGSLLGNSLRFGFAPRRWLQIFAVNAVMSALFFGIGYDLYAPNMEGLAAWQTAAMVVIFVVFGLVGLLVSGAMVNQSANPKSRIGASYDVAKKRYLSLLGVVVVELAATGVVVGAGLALFALAALGPVAVVAGMALGIIVMIAGIVCILLSFALAAQSVIVGGKRSMDALRESYRIFRAVPWPLIATLLLIGVVGYVIVLIFQIPSTIAAFIAILPSMLSTFSSSGGVLTPSYILPPWAGWVTFITNLVAVAGSSIFACMMARGLTEFYSENRKKAKK